PRVIGVAELQGGGDLGLLLRQGLAVHVHEHGCQEQEPADAPGAQRRLPLVASRDGRREFGVRVHHAPSQERPSQSVTRSRKETTSREKIPKRASPFSAVALRGSPMWPISLRSRVIQPRDAGANEGVCGTGSMELSSPTRWGASRRIIEVSHSQAWPIS